MTKNKYQYIIRLCNHDKGVCCKKQALFFHFGSDNDNVVDQRSSDKSVSRKDCNMLNNRYELLEELGKGGFAVTYKAIDHLTNRFVSIKKSKQSLKLEAKIMKHLAEVPYISNIYDYFIYDNYNYIVKRYISGYSLSDFKKNKGVITKSHILTWLDSICLILDQIHRLGVIHRDISPGNLMVSGETIYLIDFGSATSYTNKHLRNKNIYKHQGLDSPEYNNPDQQGPWTDLYSLASTLFYLLTDEGVPSPENRKIYDPIPEILLKSSLSKKQQNAMMCALQLMVKDRYDNVMDFKKEMLSINSDKTSPHRIGRVTYVAKTSIGSKDINQDNFMVDTQFRFADQDCSIQGDISCQDDEIHVVAVADGVSSTHHSELCSMAISQAVSHFVRQYRYSKIFPQLLLEDLLDYLNEKIIHLGSKIGMTASTLALFLWKGDTYYTASIGDSRIYILHHNKMKLITVPQTVAYEKISKGEFVTYSDYNRLSSYLGKKGVIGSQMAHYTTGKLHNNDVIMLCTDGIAKKIPSDKLAKYLNLKSDRILNKMWRYVDKSKFADNCTAVILKCYINEKQGRGSLS